MTHFLVRARLKRTAPISTLGRLLLPDDASSRASASHCLVWSLFAGDRAKTRDFLWREDTPGQFLILAAAPPQPNDIFEIDCKDFAPVLGAGDRLRFLLRANATVSRKVASDKRGRRADVVMAAIHDLAGDRAEARREAIGTAGRDWLARQGVTHGFRLPGAVSVDGYNMLKLPRAHAKPIVVGTLDFEGMLEIVDPASFLAALVRGFGRARAFGCGLMLIRRV